MPKVMGYFTNCLQRLNEYVDKEQKNGSEIPRFTKTQVRLIVKYLEKKDIFNFGHAIDCNGGPSCHCRAIQKEEFIRTISLINRKIPRAILETLI
jgi:hypothetical protein